MLSASQKGNQSIAQFYGKLKRLVEGCECTSLTVQAHEDYLVRDALISGLRSDDIRVRLLELEYSKADIDSTDSCISLACAIDLSSDISKSFWSVESSTVAAAKPLSQKTQRQLDWTGTSASQQVANKPRPRCQTCGLKEQTGSKCSVKKYACHKCSKARHWASVCISNAAVLQQSSDDELDTAAGLCNTGLPRANLNVSFLNLNIAGSSEPIQAILDTGSTRSFISASTGVKHGLKVCTEIREFRPPKLRTTIFRTMAKTSATADLCGRPVSACYTLQSAYTLTGNVSSYQRSRRSEHCHQGESHWRFFCFKRSEPLIPSRGAHLGSRQTLPHTSGNSQGQKTKLQLCLYRYPK